MPWDRGARCSTHLATAQSGHEPLSARQMESGKCSDCGGGGAMQAGIFTLSVRVGAPQVFWTCIVLLEAAYTGAVAFGCTSPVRRAQHPVLSGLCPVLGGGGGGGGGFNLPEILQLNLRHTGCHACLLCQQNQCHAAQLVMLPSPITPVSSIRFCSPEHLA